MVVRVEGGGERPRLAGDESNDVPNRARLIIDLASHNSSGNNFLQKCDHFSSSESTRNELSQ